MAVRHPSHEKMSVWRSGHSTPELRCFLYVGVKDPDLPDDQRSTVG